MNPRREPAANIDPATYARRWTEEFVCSEEPVGGHPDHRGKDKNQTKPMSQWSMRFGYRKRQFSRWM